MKAAVLGLGESLKEFTGAERGEITIGVNDIFRWHKTNYLVAVDRPERFTEERRNVIINSTPYIFFSQHDWQILSADIPPPKWRTEKRKLKFTSHRGSLEHLDGIFEKTDFSFNIPNEFPCPHSISSPFVAACIAYKLGATEIKLYGCDYLKHPVMFEQSKIERVKKDFTALKIELNKRGVQITCSTGSALTEILK